MSKSRSHTDPSARFLTLIALALAVLFMIFILTACARTRLETPLGTYESTRDSNLEALEIHITKLPDGSEETIVRVGGASGTASSVNDAAWDVAGRLTDRIPVPTR